MLPFGASTNQKTQLISQGGKNVEITLVSYAVTKVAYDKIIPQFVAKWKREKGQNLVIRESYGGSGSQARAVIDGLDGDIVALALAQDITKIQSAGLIKPGWEREAPNNAIVTHSVVALETRDGNPKKIQTCPLFSQTRSTSYYSKPQDFWWCAVELFGFVGCDRSRGVEMKPKLLTL